MPRAARPEPPSQAVPPAAGIEGVAPPESLPAATKAREHPAGGRYASSVIDLHAHSACSDGSDTPAELVRAAGALGLAALALSDHDTLAGIEPARREAAATGLRLVPAVELSTSVGPGCSMHLLVYFVDDPASPLGRRLEQLQEERVERNQAMVERLGACGLPIDYDDVLAEAGGNERGAGRPHMAAALVANGAAASIADAFARWLGPGSPAYVPRRRVAPEELMELAHASGGLAVVAHPDRIGLALRQLVDELARLAAAGLDGLEAYYGGSPPARRTELAELAEHLGLVPTGGSDYHGRFKGGLALGTGTGDLEVPDDVLNRLEERLADRAGRGGGPSMRRPPARPPASRALRGQPPPHRPPRAP